MNRFKPILTSKTVWLAAIAALAQVPQLAGRVELLDPEVVAGTAGAVLDLVSVFAGSGAVVTRVSATKQLGTPDALPPSTLPR